MAAVADPVVVRIEALLRSGEMDAAWLLAESLLASAHSSALQCVAAAQVALRRDAWASAATGLERALGQQPDWPPVQRQLAQVRYRMAQQADPAQARVWLEQTMALWPEHPHARTAWLELLLAEDPLGLLDALSHLSLDPASAALWRLRADAELGCVAPLLQAAQAADPAIPASTLAAATRRLAWNAAVGAAAPVFTHLAQHQPQALLHALGASLALPACVASSADLAQARARYAAGVAELPERLPPAALAAAGVPLAQLGWSNFLLAYQGQDDRELQTRYGDWLSAAAAALCPLPDPRATPRRPGRLRIGLLSSFWRVCTVGAYFGAWMEALQSAATEVWLLHLDPLQDALHQSLNARADHVIALDSRELAAAAQQVHALDLDLLLYPEIGMHGCTQVLAALRLARRQWMGYGHPVTSGLPTMDCVLSAAAMEPTEAAAHYRERLIGLPGLATRYALPERPPAATRADFGLPASGRLLLLPCSAFKWHPDGDAPLAALLAERPDVHAIYLRTEGPGAMQRLEHRLHHALNTHAVDPQRLIALPTLSRTRFLQLLGVADAMLDPWHWSGGNTSLDALHMGLPLLTRWGQFMRGRQSAAMLQMLGATEALAQPLTLLDPSDLAQRFRAELPQRLAELVDGADALGTLRHTVLQALSA